MCLNPSNGEETNKRICPMISPCNLSSLVDSYSTLQLFSQRSLQLLVQPVLISDFGMQNAEFTQQILAMIPI